jgi:N-acetylmuramoyl-L-alanine amidase
MDKVNAAEIDRWHRRNGWLKIGYHFVITRDGEVESGREPTVQGAHVKGQNHDSIGVCMVGGVDEDKQPEDNFTKEQYASLERLLNGLLRVYPDAEVKPHNFFNPNKACPSFDVEEWWTKVNS